jgi:hypothetical protein
MKIVDGIFYILERALSAATELKIDQIIRFQGDFSRVKRSL